MLSVKDFVGFFEEVHGCQPFPWQERLLAQVTAKGEWPRVLDLPTGSGKTAAIDVAVFHLALAADHAESRRAPALPSSWTAGLWWTTPLGAHGS
jgi:CRISPR-associated endonuclease/helicase Cas3